MDLVIIKAYSGSLANTSDILFVVLYVRCFCLYLAEMICCPEHMMYVNLMHNAPHHHGSCEECQQTVVSAELDTYLPKAIIHSEPLSAVLQFS